MERPTLADRRWFVAALIAISLGAVLIRLFGTGDRTLFFDEAYYIRVALLPVSDVIGVILATPPSDPLYAVVLHAWQLFAGSVDFAIRLPSVAFGALTSVAAAWLALEVTRDRAVALGSAGLVALAPYAVEFGWEATPYALASMATTLALAASWRWRRTGRTSDAMVAIGLSVVAVYSHYTAAVILALVALLAATSFAGPRGVSRRQILGLGALIAIAWLPWLIPMLDSWRSVEFARTALAHRASPAELIGALSQYSSGTGALLERVRALQVLGLGAATILLLRGWLVGGRPDHRGLRVVLIVSALTLIVPWLASAVSGQWFFVAHIMLLVLPAIAVVVAAGALVGDPTREAGARENAATRLLIRAAPVAGVALVVAQVWGLAVDATNPPHGNDGPRDLAVTLEALSQSDEPVLILPNEQQVVFERYWSGSLAGMPDDVDVRRLYRPADVTADLQASIRRFEAIAGDADRAWLVYTPARAADAQFLVWLRAHRTVTLVAERPFAQLYEVVAP